MKKELLDNVIEDAWQAVKGAIERAYYRGKADTKEELLLEAHAIIKQAEKTKDENL